MTQAGNKTRESAECPCPANIPRWPPRAGGRAAARALQTGHQVRTSLKTRDLQRAARRLVLSPGHREELINRNAQRK
jgi:hypothetical protein